VAAYPEAKNALRLNADRDVSSTSSVFHTLLGLAGMKSPYYDETQSLISYRYNLKKRRYINDYNESVDLNHCGLREQDFEMLRKQGIKM
jgi:hypothetical protein